MDEHHPHTPVQRSLLTPSRLLAVAFIAVSAVSGDGDHAIATIRFAGSVTKHLSLAWAPLSRRG